MSRRRPCVDREWVKTSMLSKQIPCSGQCATCRTAHAGAMWHNIKTGEDCCASCFNNREEKSDDNPNPEQKPQPANGDAVL